ncbi:hypothetical protein [Malonomonas rubra]|uniref:hypothetical protein n=1 Tax=Malonomonas rubra TaxID=57040 RepID=UPI001114E6FB|nr:hypothetical protein [Malonomonas rubra]
MGITALRSEILSPFLSPNPKKRKRHSQLNAVSAFILGGQNPALGRDLASAAFVKVSQKDPPLTLQNQFVLQTGHKSGHPAGQIPADTNIIYLILFYIDYYQNGKESGQNEQQRHKGQR